MIRAGMLKLGGGVLGKLLEADPGYRGPRVDCGAGHQAEFVSYRDKVIDTVLGPVTLTRAWYHCADCKHGLAPRDAELGVPGCQPVLAVRAVIPGAGEGDRAEHGVDDLVPVGDELCLMPGSAVHAGTAVAGIGFQQLPQHAAAELQHPGADHGLGCLQAGLAAQRPGGLRGQPAYLCGRLRRERFAEPPFSPPAGGAPASPSPAAGDEAGRASQIASFTCTSCSLTAMNCL